jgi:hypothetical protein
MVADSDLELGQRAVSEVLPSVILETSWPFEVLDATTVSGNQSSKLSLQAIVSFETLASRLIISIFLCIIVPPAFVLWGVGAVHGIHWFGT